MERGKRGGMGLLLTAFALYVTGLRPAHVPPAELPARWTRPAAEWLRAAGLTPGWGWLRFAGYADYLALLGVGALATVTLVCFLRVLPIFARERKWAMFFMALAQIIVLLLAASGRMRAGHG